MLAYQEDSVKMKYCDCIILSEYLICCFIIELLFKYYI